MYKFIKTENYEEFDTFVEKSKESSFMQTTKWIPLKSTWNPHLYTGYNDNNEVVLTALVLERKLPLVGKIWYSPSGFIADYSNSSLINEFTKFIKKELEHNGAAMYIVDPQIMERINDEVVNDSLIKVNNLKEAGFIYNEKRDEYTYQPPLTIGLSLKDAQGNLVSKEALLKKFDKGIRYSVRVGEQRGLVAESYTYDDISNNMHLYDDFLSVMNDTSERVGFVTRPHDYYLEFMQQLAKWTTIDLIYYDRKKDENNYIESQQRLLELNSKLEKETNEKTITKYKTEITSVEKAIESYQQRIDELAKNEIDAERICVACGVTIRFNDEACCLFGGTRNILRNAVRSSHYLNFLRIDQSIKTGMSFHDLGRVPHEYTNENSANHGLYKFKRSFAADKIEYIGEYILINSKLKYFIYHSFMPNAKKIKLELVKMIKKIKK